MRSSGSEAIREPSVARRIALVITLALCLHAPSLSAGYLADDFGAQLVLDGRIESPTWKPWSLYDFGTFTEAPALTAESGAFPWWIDRDWKVRFFRPLTSLSLWLDHALFGASPFAGHAMSLALFALLLLAAWRLYRKLGLSQDGALLALVIVAADNGAMMPVGWISNRNPLLEGLFAVLALHAALCTIERPAVHRLVTTLALAIAAVGAKESGLHVFALLALLFLWALQRPEQRPVQSSPPLTDPQLPLQPVQSPLVQSPPAQSPTQRHFFTFAAGASAVLAAAYLAAYATTGFGSNVLFYPMPWTSPGEFIFRTATLFACAPIAAVSPFPIDLLAIEPASFWPIVVTATLLGAVVVWFLARRLWNVPRAGLLLTWGALALLPQSGAPPSDRLLFTPMLAWAPLLALFLLQVLPKSATPLARNGERRFAWTIATTSTLLSALMVFGLAAALAHSCGLLRRVIRTADVGPADLGVRHAIVLQASPTSLLGLGPLSAWLLLGGSDDVRFHALQGGQRALTWERLDATHFALESCDEPFLSLPMESVYQTHTLEPGEPRVWTTHWFTVRGTPDHEGNLRHIEVDLGSSLDDPHWRFLLYDGERLVHQPPPKVGERVDLPRSVRDPFLP